MTDSLKTFIREIPNWPKNGVSYKDITPLLQDNNSFIKAVNRLAYGYKKYDIHKILGIEARGFIFASPVAYVLGKALIIVRKPGKLPFKTRSQKYDLEYGTEELHLHIDSISPGENILIVDDVLATGGTSLATAKLVEKSGGKVVGLSFLIELTFLKGRKKLSKYKVKSLIKY